MPTHRMEREDDDGLPTVAGAPVSEAIFHVARAHRATAGHLLRETGLYPGQELLMLRLWEAGEQRQADLIKLLELDPSTVTKMLQRLEQAGLVARRTSVSDRRTVVVSATRAGQALRAQVEQAWRELEQLTTAGMAEEERGVALRLLERMAANLADQPLAADAAAGTDRRQAERDGEGVSLEADH